MNPFLNEIFHILYPIYYKYQLNQSNDSPSTSISTTIPPSSATTSSSSQKVGVVGSITMDGYLLYIFGIVVRDIRLYSKSSIGDIIHEIKEFNRKLVPVIPHAYELLFKSLELIPYNWSNFFHS